MNRDMDMVRKIALAIADHPDPNTAITGINGVDTLVFCAHAQWMVEAGLISAALLGPGPHNTSRQAMIWRLTWQGCDFVDAVRSDTLWAKAKQVVLKPSGSWTFGVLLDWLKDQIAGQLPTF